VNELLIQLTEITQRAAQVIREVYDKPFEVEYKSPRDPVTAADKRANALICDALERAFPGVPVVAEESDPSSFEGYRAADRVFFVDPLDGTREFIDKNGQFVVMIGLVEGERAIAGVVHAPAQRKLWTGFVGGGAYEADEGGAPRPVAVSRVEALADSRVVASRSHRSPLLESVIEAIGPDSTLPVGSAGLKGARIATGAADIYVGPGKAGKRWDVCAVDAIVTAAGGKLTDAHGVAFDYRTQSLENDRGILATNGALHDAVLSCLATVNGG
jgi:3'(2'), 5'-bisphosphate nucleotidase